MRKGYQRIFTREVILAFILGLQFGIFIAASLRQVYVTYTTTNVIHDVTYPDPILSKHTLPRYPHPLARNDVMYDDVTMLLGEFGNNYDHSSSTTTTTKTKMTSTTTNDISMTTTTTTQQQHDNNVGNIAIQFVDIFNEDNGFLM